MVTNSENAKFTFEQWMDQFETNWTENAWSELIERQSQFTLEEFTFEHWIEVARVDVDLHYMRGLDVDLNRYDVIGKRFDSSETRGANAGRNSWRETIAFEDFRGRSRSPFPCDPQRWTMYLTSPYPVWLEGLKGASSIPGEANLSVESKPFWQTRWPVPGDRIGEFEIVDQVGSGSFSKVYLANQTTVGRRKVVLKLTTEQQDEPEWLGRFQHENIVPVYSVHRWKEFYVLCMPFWGTLTLAEWMRQQPNSHNRSAHLLAETLHSAAHKLPSTLVDSEYTTAKRKIDIENSSSSNSEPLSPSRSSTSVETAMSLFQQLAGALKHSHSQGVLHGDLKPANVLIRSDSSPALLDFNLSQEAGQGSTRVKGSTPYMAPEQLRGWSDGTPVMTPATDIYALGLMLYEYLTGSLPDSFRTSVTTDKLPAIASERASFDFSNRLKTVPVGLRSIILKALQPTAQERYAAAAELEEDLQREASQRQLAFAPDPHWNRCRKFVKRNKNSFSMTSMLVVACCASLFAIIGLWQWRSMALRQQAVRTTNDFLLKSQSLLGQLHSVEGTLDRQISSNLLGLTEDYTPVLFGDSSATWEWLDDSEKKRLHDGWVRHVLISNYAAHRSMLLVDTTSRDAWLNLCNSFPLQFSSLAISVMASTKEQSLLSDLERLDPVAQDPFLMATIAGEQRDWSNTLEYLNRVPESERNSGLYWFLVGRSQLMLDDLDGATLSFGLAADRSELAVLARFGRGMTYLKQHRASKAVEEFSQVIQASPEFIDAYVQRSIAYEMLQKWDSALVDLNRVLESDPHRTTARSIRIRVLEQLGRKQDASQDQQLVLSIEPKRSTDFVTRALSRLPQDVDGAWDDLCRAEELDPTQPMVRQNKAYVASEFRKDDTLAVRQLDKLLQLSSCDVEALSGRAVLHARLANDTQAIADIEKALRLKTGRGGPTHYHASCVFALVSQRDPAFVKRAHSHLAKSLQFGYGLDIVDDDLDLKSIRHTPQFQEIVRVAQLASTDPLPNSTP